MKPAASRLCWVETQFTSGPALDQALGVAQGQQVAGDAGDHRVVLRGVVDLLVGERGVADPRHRARPHLRRGRAGLDVERVLDRAVRALQRLELVQQLLRLRLRARRSGTRTSPARCRTCSSRPRAVRAPGRWSGCRRSGRAAARCRTLCAAVATVDLLAAPRLGRASPARPVWRASARARGSAPRRRLSAGHAALDLAAAALGLLVAAWPRRRRAQDLGRQPPGRRRRRSAMTAAIRGTKRHERARDIASPSPRSGRAGNALAAVQALPGHGFDRQAEHGLPGQRVRRAGDRQPAGLLERAQGHVGRVVERAR